MDGTNPTWTLAELAEAAGLTRRTVRYYIARGLLPGPAGAGRGARYGPAHLERLLEIRRLQDRGLTLDAIATALAGGAPRVPTPASRTVTVYTVAPDVTVHVQDGLPPWRVHRIRRALKIFAAALAGGDADTASGDQPGAEKMEAHHDTE